MAEHPELRDITKALRAREVSCRALAIASGVHHSTVISWRDGTSSPRLDTLQKVQSALKKLRRERKKRRPRPARRARKAAK